MQNRTKKALEDSLKKLLKVKSLDKITINDLTEECGISRMAFYYHFRDIYHLIEWSCIEDARQALQGKKTYDTWKEGYLQIFEEVKENKNFVVNVYNSVGREQIENYLYKLTYDLLIGVVEEQSKGMNITKEEKMAIANYHKYAFVGIMLDWIKNNMKQNPKQIVNDVGTILQGTINLSIYNFLKKYV